MANSISDALFLYFEILYGVSWNLPAKSQAGRNNYIIVAVILTEPITKLLTLPISIAHKIVFLDMPLYLFENTLAEDICPFIQIWWYITKPGTQAICNLCQKGKVDVGKELHICPQMQRILRNLILKTIFFYRIQWLDDPAGEMSDLKNLPSNIKHNRSSKIEEKQNKKNKNCHNSEKQKPYKNNSTIKSRMEKNIFDRCEVFEAVPKVGKSSL